jgi:hypothetical protein
MLPAPLLLSSFTVRHGTSLLTSHTSAHRAAQYFTPFGVQAAWAPCSGCASGVGQAVAGALGELPQGTLLASGL